MDGKRNGFSYLKFGLLSFSISALIVGGVFGSEEIYQVFAAKGKDGDGNYLGNGYPSGPHENMNVHGKKIGQPCDPTPGGKSVFILLGEPGDPKESTITIVQNKRSGVTELTAKDPCAEHWNNSGIYCANECGDPVLVQLPYDSQGYLLFARVPGNYQYNTEASITVYPNPDIMACNDSGHEDFPDLTECPDDPDNTDLLALGLVTKDGVFDLMENTWVEGDFCDKGKCKGKSKAIDVTELYLWTGYICDDSIDTDGDGIDAHDVPPEYDTNGTPGIQDDEIRDYLDDIVAGNYVLPTGTCTKHDSEFVFNLADLVGVDNTFSNEGTKLLKFRWYGLSSTQWTN